MEQAARFQPQSAPISPKASIVCYTYLNCLTDAVVAEEASKRAIVYVQEALLTATPIGHGHGPVNHLHSIQERALPQ
jgi:hydroxymethylpyrimidine/phosphomethylpyrimidine kinase